MLVGCEAVFADGTVTRIKNVPRRAVGPDIRHVVIGNEGALCYITEVTVKLFPYLPQNNAFIGWTLKSMRTGFEALREVMVAGYRPSVARLYDPPDGAFHFGRFAAKDDCVLLFMAEGPAGVVKATIEGIREVVARFAECRPVDAHHLEEWFADLNWGPDKLANERKEILATRTMGRTTEVSADWSSICDIYENALRRLRDEVPDITVAGGHSSHSYVNGTNMYFIYYYDVKCPPEQEVTKYRYEINRVICEETLKLGGSVVHHHGMGKARTPWAHEEYGSSWYILEGLKRVFDPNDIMNKGTILPR
jgi:alkyldihydroxyacetonephosphate synthase